MPIAQWLTRMRSTPALNGAAVNDCIAQESLNDAESADQEDAAPPQKVRRSDNHDGVGLFIIRDWPFDMELRPGRLAGAGCGRLFARAWTCTFVRVDQAGRRRSKARQ